MSILHSLHSLHLLLIDDSPEWYDLLSRVFAGHTVEWAQTAEAASLALADQRPDAILIDGKLPDIDGPVVARLIRMYYQERGECEPPIFGLTGYPDMAEAFHAQWIPTLLKGMSIFDLREQVEALVSAYAPAGVGR